MARFGHLSPWIRWTCVLKTSKLALVAARVEICVYGMRLGETMAATNRSLYLPDFMTGIIAALAINRIPSLSLRGNRLDIAFDRLSRDIDNEAQKENLDVKFRIRVHPIHHDSTQHQQALYEAAQRDLISLDNPEFQRIRLKLSAEDALPYLEGLPGSPGMYQRLASLLVRYYEQPADSQENQRAAAAGA
jgi:hypothetical protein